MRDPIQLSVLGFGCAPVMGKVGKTQAMNAMAQAFDLGVTHFDVARSYGFGRAEQVLGTFIKGRRDKVTITTKFGVVPPQLSLRTKTAIPVARIMARAFPGLKDRLKNKSGQLLEERNFDTGYARKCLDQSLAALGSDYVDIYLVHEPEAELLRNPKELCGFLDDCVAAGKIRRWGFAYKSVQDYEWAGAMGGDVIQFEGNVETLPKCGAVLDDTRQRIITRPFIGGLIDSSSLRDSLHTLNLEPTLLELNASLTDVSLCLSRQLAGLSGSVLTSMFSQEHIKKNVLAINAWEGNEKMDYLVKKLMVNLLNTDETISL